MLYALLELIACSQASKQASLYVNKDAASRLYALSEGDAYRQQVPSRHVSTSLYGTV